LLSEPITIFGDGTQTRDFTHVSDVVRAIQSTLEIEGSTPSVYNIGGGTPASLSEAIELVEDLAGRPLRIDRKERSRGGVKDTAADTGRAVRDLGFRTRVSLREGLAQEMEWMERCLGSDQGGVTRALS